MGNVHRTIVIVRLNSPTLNHPLSSSLAEQITTALVCCSFIYHIYFLSFNHTARCASVCICGEESWWKSGQFPAAFIFSCGRGAASRSTGGSFFNRIRRLGMSMWLRCMLSVCIIILRAEYNARVHNSTRRHPKFARSQETCQRLQLLEIVCGGVVCSLWRRVLVFWKVARLICCERRVTPAPLMEVTGALTWCGRAIILWVFKGSGVRGGPHSGHITRGLLFLRMDEHEGSIFALL
jgi:hypothetical protein